MSNDKMIFDDAINNLDFLRDRGTYQATLNGWSQD
jgi:serine protease inhibitor